jgi:hypothetical protein
MHLDLTFRFDIPISFFPQVQAPIAEFANEVQPDQLLKIDVTIPGEDGNNYLVHGYLVGAKESYV